MAAVPPGRLPLLVGRGTSARVWISDQLADAGPLQINRQNVEVKIRDRIAMTSIKQEFFSRARGPITANYLFPTPREATVTGFAYWVKGHKIKITFQSRITPVLPDTIMRVRIDYLQALPYVRNEVTCLVPLRTLGVDAPLASLEVDVDMQDQSEIARYSSPSHLAAVRFRSPRPTDLGLRWCRVGARRAAFQALVPAAPAGPGGHARYV